MSESRIVLITGVTRGLGHAMAGKFAELDLAVIGASAQR
jgi:NAD(P)-dependent dehydrogenase (short-subunit alcohol dehydrogenase family)